MLCYNGVMFVVVTNMEIMQCCAALYMSCDGKKYYNHHYAMVLPHVYEPLFVLQDVFLLIFIIPLPLLILNYS